jgi:hypothetical protein
MSQTRTNICLETAQPPAVAALLCSARGELAERAVTATYLDLIARGFLRRAEGPEGQAGIELAAAAEASLRPYERSVLDHVVSRAGVGGDSAPESALRLESSDHAKVWMTTFTKRVVSDARGRGLVLERISLSAVFWLWVGLAVPAGLAPAAGAWIWLCLLTYVVLAWRVLVLHRPLPTGAGQAGCCRIPGLGVQLKAETAALKRDSSSASRTSAFAVGLGIAGPTQSLFAPQLDRTVWSLRNLATDTHR